MNYSRITNKSESLVSKAFRFSAIGIILVYIIHIISPSILPVFAMRFISMPKADQPVLSSEINILLRENIELKNLLGYDVEYIWAPVLLSSLTPYETIVINMSGVSDKPPIGSKVFAPNIIALGTITRYVKDNAIVSLYSEPSRTYEVSLASTTATARGKGGGNFEADIPRGVDISIGDPIIITSTIPQLIGEVGDILIDPAQPFGRVLFRLPINIKQLKYVLVER